MFLEHLPVPCPVSAAGDGDVIETPWLWSGTPAGLLIQSVPWEVDSEMDIRVWDIV